MRGYPEHLHEVINEDLQESIYDETLEGEITKDSQYALEIMKQELKNKYISPEILYAFKASIQALEKQIFFENQISHIHSWFVDNKDCLLDSGLTISIKSFNRYNDDGKIDEVDLEFIVSDVVDEIQKGVLNVLSTLYGRV